MYPTYEHLVLVSQDQNLTPSQKMHEIFKSSKTQPLSTYVNEDYLGDELLHPELTLEDKEAVSVEGDGQIILFRNSENKYFFIDSGSFTEYEGQDYVDVTSIDDEDNIDKYFSDLLSTDDSLLLFSTGYFVDEDLQKSLLNSYPQN